MGSIDWGDVLRGALAFFLVVVGIGIAYVCFRLGGMLGRMSRSVGQMTDEVVPILNRAQTTVDGINLELQRVDEIMVSAVHATKGAEKTVTSISGAVTAPVKKASGLAAAAKEAYATFRARRAAGPEVAEHAAEDLPVSVVAARPPEQPPTPPQGASVTADREPHVHQPAADAAVAVPEPPATVNGSASGWVEPDLDEMPIEVRRRERGPSLSQISWALPKRRVG